MHTGIDGFANSVGGRLGLARTKSMDFYSTVVLLGICAELAGSAAVRLWCIPCGNLFVCRLFVCGNYLTETLMGGSFSLTPL